MIKNLPEHVEKILDEWETISYYAYDNFVKIGRGSVIAIYEDDVIKFSYLNNEYFVENNLTRDLELIENYVPEDEIIVTFEDKNNTRTIRIRTNKNGRNPKGIWFFKTLEKVNNDPNFPLDMLPEWFLNAIEKLIKLQEEKK